MPDPHRLTILTQLRKVARLSLSDMARACGLAGNQSHQTAGAWELGQMIPAARRRAPFLYYLWDRLALRHQPTQFEAVWEILTEEWHWAPLSDREWHTLTQQPRPGSAVPAEHAQSPTPHSAFPIPHSPPPFQAPALTPHFVGRTEEFAQIAECLRDPAGTRVIALVGMGGIGKTTLATGLAHHLRTHFADGVLWARVATAHPLDVLQSWATAYGYDFSGLSDVESRAAAVRNLLAQKTALLVLDDVRASDAAQLLLPNTTTCAVLITTRSQEVAAALHATPISLPELSAEAALALLTRLLGDARVHAELTAAQAIGAALHYLPLALEIAAQRLVARPQQPLATLLGHLQDATVRLNQLTVSDRAVRTAFTVSWQQMSPPLQQIFAHLGLFGGRSFAVEALARVAACEPAVAQEHLWSLQALSLVKDEGPARYRQHPLLADFAREQLGEDALAASRLSDYYLTFARQHQTDYALLEPEWDNLMAAMEGAYTWQQWQVVIDYAEVLTEPWMAGARYTQARQGYTWAIIAANSLSILPTLVNLLVDWGYICAEQNDYAEAETHLHAAITIADQLCLEKLGAQARLHLARIAMERGNHEEVDQWLHDCQHLFLQVHDHVGLTKVTYRRAFLAYRTGDYAQAERLCTSIIRQQEQAGETTGAIATLRLLTDVACAQLDYAQAEQYGLRALQMAQTAGLKNDQAECYFEMATVNRCNNQFDRAWAYAEAARQLFEHIGNRSFYAYTLYEESVILARKCDHQTALSVGHSSYQLLSALDDVYTMPFCLLHLGDLYQILGDADESRQYWQKAYNLAHKNHHPLTEIIERSLNAH